MDIPGILLCFMFVVIIIFFVCIFLNYATKEKLEDVAPIDSQVCKGPPPSLPCDIKGCNQEMFKLFESGTPFGRDTQTPIPQKCSTCPERAFSKQDPNNWRVYIGERNAWLPCGTGNFNCYQRAIHVPPGTCNWLNCNYAMREFVDKDDAFGPPGEGLKVAEGCEFCPARGYKAGAGDERLVGKVWREGGNFEWVKSCERNNRIPECYRRNIELVIRNSE